MDKGIFQWMTFGIFRNKTVIFQLREKLMESLGDSTQLVIHALIFQSLVSFCKRITSLFSRFRGHQLKRLGKPEKFLGQGHL